MNKLCNKELRYKKIVKYAYYILPKYVTGKCIDKIIYIINKILKIETVTNTNSLRLNV